MMRISKIVFTTLLLAVSLRLLYLMSAEHFAKDGEVAIYYLLAFGLISAYYRSTIFGAPLVRGRERIAILTFLTSILGILVVYFVFRTFSADTFRFDRNASFMSAVSWLYFVLALAMIFGDSTFGAIGRWLEKRRARDRSD